MTIKATTKNFIQLVDIKDFRFEGDCSNIDYGNIAGDCNSKPFLFSKRLAISV